MVPFYGDHQAGIATAAQDKLVFASFDLTTRKRGELRDLLREWTVAAAAMSAGKPVGGDDSSVAPPGDTGEALGLGPARLTVTFGLGPSLFARSGLGLAARRPSALQPIGKLPGDALSPERSDGDLCVQACANDPQVALPRDAQPRTHRARGRRPALDAVRVRPHRIDDLDAGDGAEPAGLQGRDQQPPRRRPQGDEEVRLGRKRGAAAVVPQRHLPRRAAHPDADRVVGPGLAGRAGSDHRSSQAERRTALRRWRARHRRSRPARHRRCSRSSR